MACLDVCQVILIFILPPCAVSIEKGMCSRPMIVNVFLTLLFFLPGIIHAALVVGGVVATDVEGRKEKKARRAREAEVGDHIAADQI